MVYPPETFLKPVLSRVIYNKNKTGRLFVVFASSYIAESLDSLNETNNWLIRFNDDNATQIFKKFKSFITARTSIQLQSTEGDLQIVFLSDDKAEVIQPDWIKKGGIGYVILSHVGEVKLVAKAKAGEEIKIQYEWLPHRSDT